MKCDFCKFPRHNFYQQLSVSTFFAMTTKVHIKVEGSVKWLDVNRKMFIDCLAEHSGGRYSSLKNKKSAWKLVVADFNVKTGLSYDKQVLATQVQSLKKNWTIFDQFANNSGFGMDPKGMVTAAPEALNTYFQAHPKAAQFSSAPIPFYSEIRILFSRK